VEAALLAHPAVADAGVVGAEAEGGLLKPVAFVVARGGGEPETLAEELAGHVAARLPSHQRPRRIRVVEELPRTVTGKLQRYVLREWAERTL
jgi:acyl-coenzyme A synthetase/AMP-(fatty) acid ligase